MSNLQDLHAFNWNLNIPRLWIIFPEQTSSYRDSLLVVYYPTSNQHDNSLHFCNYYSKKSFLQWKCPFTVVLLHQNPLTYLFRTVLDCLFPLVNSAWSVHISLLIQTRWLWRVGRGREPWERSEAGGVNDNERHLHHSPVSSPTEELRKDKRRSDDSGRRERTRPGF